MERATPSAACSASLRACTLVILALVATTASVVLRPPKPPVAPRFICSWVSMKSWLVGLERAPATIFPVAGSRTSPKALTATRLETSTPAGSITVKEPTPYFMACFMPRILPMVAPVPAPTQPSLTASVVAAAAAAADATFFDGVGGGGRGSGFAHGHGGTHAGLADTEIVKDGGGDD